MKFTKFVIENYRAIKQIALDFNHSIIPLIGVNESGKTSILHAILAYDNGQDRLNQGYHLEYINRYDTLQKQKCEISAHICLSDKDYEKLYKAMRTPSDHEAFGILHKHKKEKENFIIKRVLSEPSKPYILVHPKIDDEKIEKRIISHIANNQPYILYFDDFTDRVPSEVTFSQDYITNGQIKGKAFKEWQCIIEEIFNKSDTEGINSNSSNQETPLQAFMKLIDKDLRDGVLYDITDVLEKEIIAEWKKMKKSGLKKLADDSEKLELLINYDDKAFTFEFKVRDKSKEDKKRIFNVTQRSKGFQWFFNYMIKLKFNPRYKQSSKNSIYLLDEPGSYLHASAQIELLKELQKVSETNTLIYCTHSHHLLNPSIIKLGSIRIAEKNRGNISLVNFGNYEGKNENGALSPIYQALQLNITNDFIGKIVIFEGITDFYFFSIIQNNSTLIPKNIILIPGSGSGSSTTLISLGLSFADSFVVIFDNDQGGRDAIKKYKGEFGQEIVNNFQFYGTKDGTQLENLLSASDSNYLMKVTNSNSIKKSLGIFFYDKKDFHKNLVDNLSKETIKNLEPALNRINSM